MTKNTEPDLDFIMRVFRIFNGGRNGLARDQLSWRTDWNTEDGEFFPLCFFIDCSDMFWWGCADGEDLTPQNIHVLEKAIEDIIAIKRIVRFYAYALFCCRVRGMRPQGAYYKHIPKELWQLFNACGAEREVDTGNPHPIPDDKKEAKDA